ncbi:conserved hypothetical protein [Trichinella spiralis]|uniref:hypothetical protein n=1 Tax=Trichinella spiralis TaxID=6334 RepID=UPI0001EFC6A2|nr:conserved hypothetical protein [Trichinella spiralis]
MLFQPGWPDKVSSAGAHQFYTLFIGAVCRLDCVKQSARGFSAAARHICVYVILLKNKIPKHQTTHRHLSIKQSCSSINLYKLYVQCLFCVKSINNLIAVLRNVDFEFYQTAVKC